MINDLLIRDFSNHRKEIENLNSNGAFCNSRLKGDACYFSKVSGEFEHVGNNLANGESDIPQLVLVGHLSVNDLYGKFMFSIIVKILHDKFEHSETGVKVAILPNIDHMLNTLLRNAQILLQLSHKEGCEIKVSEAIAKGKPVMVYKSGGIPLQVKDNVNGKNG